MHSPILAPVMALIAWTLVILGLLYARRLPALTRAGIDLRRVRGSRPGQLDQLLKAKDQWPAHNYMHLVEQPTLFYALCFALALLEAGTGAALGLAWLYVALRVAHSVVQVTTNRIIVRFSLFGLASVTLTALSGPAIVALLRG